MNSSIKKITIVFLFVINITVAYTQEPEAKYSFQINPLVLLLDVIEFGVNYNQETYSYFFSLEFQYKINNYWNVLLRSNFSISNYYNGASSIHDMYGNTMFYKEFYQKNTIISFMPGVIFRPFGTGLRGMYVGLYPNIGWQNVETENIDDYYNSININDNFLVLGIGAEAGYEWIFKNGFTITLGGGFGKNWGIESKGNSGDLIQEDVLYNFRFTFMMGYSF
jgi:hypothetical protein